MAHGANQYGSGPGSKKRSATARKSNNAGGGQQLNRSQIQTGINGGKYGPVLGAFLHSLLGMKPQMQKRTMTQAWPCFQALGIQIPGQTATSSTKTTSSTKRRTTARARGPQGQQAQRQAA